MSVWRPEADKQCTLHYSLHDWNSDKQMVIRLGTAKLLVVTAAEAGNGEVLEQSSDLSREEALATAILTPG